MKKIISNLFFLVLSIGAVGYASLQLHQLGALPIKYEVSVIGILFVFILLLYVISIRFKNKFASIFMKLLLTILSVCLLVGGYYIHEGFSAFRKMTMPTAQINEMSLISLTESELTGIEDIDTIAFFADGSSYFNTSMEVIKQSNPDVRFTILQDNAEIMNALYEKQVDAILIRESYRMTYEEMKPSFSWETEKIWNYLITEEITDFSKDVNVVNTPFTVFLSGIDTYGDISYVSRTDVNMLVTVNPNTKQVLLTSIPRDTWVVLDNMGDYDKLTHSGLEGVENSVKTIENFLNIDINYYARVNFTSLIQIVDAVDGIEVNNPTDFTAYYKPWTHFPEGIIELNGETALEYARERHAFDYMFEDSERGDQIRVENQQRVVEAIANKVLSPALLTNFQGLLTALEGTFETNITTDEMMSLVRMQLDDMSSWKFISQKVLGEYDYRYGGAYMPNWNLIYYIPDEASVQDVVSNINAVLNNQMLK